MTTITFLLAAFLGFSTTEPVAGKPVPVTSTNEYITTIIASSIQAPSIDELAQQETTVQMKVKIGKHGKMELISLETESEQAKLYVLKKLSGVRIPSGNAFEGRILDLEFILKATAG